VTEWSRAWIYTFERMDAFLKRFIGGGAKTVTEGGGQRREF